MPDLRKTLTELIDAFATAKATGNELLTRSAAEGLVEFLETIEITERQAAEDEDGGQE